MATAKTQARELRVFLEFVAGFCATIFFHQPALWLLHIAGVTPRTPYVMTPVPPFGIPAVISLAFWGGVWGLILIPAISRIKNEGAYFLRSPEAMRAGPVSKITYAFSFKYALSVRFRFGAAAALVLCSLIGACASQPQGTFASSDPLGGERIVLLSDGSFRYTARSDDGGVYFAAEGKWRSISGDGTIETVIENVSTGKESCCDPLRHAQRWLLTRKGLVRAERPLRYLGPALPQPH